MKTKVLKMKVNRDLILKARQANLLAYLESNGYTFKREGKHYRCVEHTSLIVTPPNAFCWNSKGINGNSIDFLIKGLGRTFKEAVEELTNIDLEQQKSQPQTEPADGYIVNNSFLKRAYGYLIRNRGIQYNIVSDLVKKGYINMIDKGPYDYPIIGFKVLNEHKEPIGYELHGTFDKAPFKGLTTDTKYGYGFNIAIANPNKAFFFESAVDLISFYQLCRTKKLDIDINDSILVSLAGLKESTLKHMLKAFKINSKPFVCVDNDNAGLEFKKLLESQQIAFKEMLPPTNYKDWNQILQEVEK